MLNANTRNRRMWKSIYAGSGLMFRSNHVTRSKTFINTRQLKYIHMTQFIHFVHSNCVRYPTNEQKILSTRDFVQQLMTLSSITVQSSTNLSKFPFQSISRKYSFKSYQCVLIFWLPCTTDRFVFVYTSFDLFIMLSFNAIRRINEFVHSDALPLCLLIIEWVHNAFKWSLNSRRTLAGENEKKSHIATTYYTWRRLPLVGHVCTL